MVKLLTPLNGVAHGGNLSQAISQFGGDIRDWLDVSTGISPFSWYDGRELTPPVSVMQALPQASEALQQALHTYYGRTGLVAAGSQALIRLLPQCFSAGRVWVLQGTYGEHLRSWQQAGFIAEEKTAAAVRSLLRDGCPDEAPDMLVLVNPGNPGGETFSAAELSQWADSLQQQGGWLVLDETFIDCTPERSFLQQPEAGNVLILRSPGKFFGLAGLRCGFLFAPPAVCASVASRLDPWPVSGFSLWLVTQALNDRAWQLGQRQRLQQAGERLARLVQPLPCCAATPLFVTLQSGQVAAWHRQLAQQKIWSRLFVRQQRLRVGLPATEDGWQRLQHGLRTL